MSHATLTFLGLTEADQAACASPSAKQFQLLTQMADSQAKITHFLSLLSNTAQVHLSEIKHTVTLLMSGMTPGLL